MDKIRQALDRARAERAEVAADAGATAVLAGQPWPEAVRPGRAAAPEAPPAAAAAPPEAAARLFDVGPLALERNRLVVEERTNHAARAFRMLRTQVLQRMRERGWRTLGVASARSGDGKTTTAINLALAIASGQQETVLLADLDLRRPGVARCFGLSPEYGVEEVLRGERRIPECLYRPRTFDKLVLLPARQPVVGSSELVAGARFERLVAELRSRYADRIVIFDVPPVLEMDDASAIAPYVDCVLYVVAEGATAREDVIRGLELLARTPLIGTVLNRSAQTISSDSYG